MINLVEMCSDEQHPSPCANGNIIDGHACYCHVQHDDAPRKCPIWRNFGESDLSKWHGSGDFNADDWDGGCKWFVSANVDVTGTGKRSLTGSGGQHGSTALPPSSED